MDRSAEKRYEKAHERKVYDERQLAKTVESARQSAKQQAKQAQEALSAARKSS